MPSTRRGCRRVLVVPPTAPTFVLCLTSCWELSTTPTQRVAYERREDMVDYSKYRHIKADRQGKVLKLSFNRPENLNAVNSELHAELAGIFGEVGRDRDAA